MASNANCPEWVDNVSKADEDAHIAAVRKVTKWIALNASAYPTQEHIQTIHLELFRDFVPIPYYAGNFRQENASWPCLAITVGVGLVPGEKFETVLERMTDYCQAYRQLRSDLNLHLPSNNIRAVQLFAATTAFLVGEFIRIHPFINGNGRVSRLLWYWSCSSMRLSRQCRIYPRPESSSMYSVLMSSCMRGDDTPLALEIIRTIASKQELLSPRAQA